MSQMSKVGVIGAGAMGSGIVQKVAQEGFDVIMIDTKKEFVDRGLSNIRSTLAAGIKRKILSSQKAEETLSHISGTTDFSRVADADIIVEAVFEDKGVTTEVFKKLDAICQENTIFATNTSSFYVREFAAQTLRPDRFIGLHYFFHPAKNRLLEIIPHEGTSADTLEKALLFAKLHGKTPIKVADTPGFAVNRFFVPYLNESARMLEEGLANAATIEAGAKAAFKIGMGPFELMNASNGTAIAVHSADTLGRELGPFYATAPLLREMMEKKADWDLSEPVDESKLPAIIDRYLGVCLGVAATLVEEGGATKEDTDRGAKIGLAWAEGPFEIMNRIGIEKAHGLVSAIAEKYLDFKVPALLNQQLAQGTPFTFNLVDLEIKNDIAFVTINRPEALNALNEAVFGQLEEKFTEAESNPSVKGIVFQGAGKAFVAGADIKYFVDNIRSDNIAATDAFTRRGHELLLRIENCSKPTIAYLDGLSLGGGSELALACQKIIATEAGSMGFPETAIGIFPGLGGMLRSARHMGTALAKYYVFTGSFISAQDALDLGMASKIIMPDAFEAEVRALINEDPKEKYQQRDLPEKYRSLAAAFSRENVENLLSGKTLVGVPDELASKLVNTIGRKAPIALRMANEIMDEQEKVSIKEAIEIELSRLTDIFSTADALEGLSSTLEKRRPTFKGA